MLTGTYSYGLVALSWVFAVLASYTAIEITRVVARRHGQPAAAWVFAGGLALGIGIWTMHFVGMLAFRMRMPHTWDFSVTGLSMAIAVAASAFVIWHASRKTENPLSIGISGIMLGTGIAAMHYAGMAAMRMNIPVVRGQA